MIPKSILEKVHSMMFPIEVNSVCFVQFPNQLTMYVIENMIIFYDCY